MSDTLDDRVAAIRAGAEREVLQLISTEEERLAVLSRRLEEVSAALAAREDELRSIAAGLGAAMEGFAAEVERLEGLGALPAVPADASAPPEVRVSDRRPPLTAPVLPDVVPSVVTVRVPVHHRDATPDQGSRRASRLRGVRAARTPSEAPAGRWGRGSDSDEELDRARLTALDMAARGRSRDEVVAHLRDDLGVADPDTIIDYVFGASTPSSVVPGWPPRRRLRRSA